MKGEKATKPREPTNPCSHWYPGTRPFEAPEVNNMANWITTLPNLIGFINLRSYGQMRGSSQPFYYFFKLISTFSFLAVFLHVWPISERRGGSNRSCPRCFEEVEFHPRNRFPGQPTLSTRRSFHVPLYIILFHRPEVSVLCCTPHLATSSTGCIHGKPSNIHMSLIWGTRERWVWLYLDRDPWLTWTCHPSTASRYRKNGSALQAKRPVVWSITWPGSLRNKSTVRSQYRRRYPSSCVWILFLSHLSNQGISEPVTTKKKNTTVRGPFWQTVDFDESSL